MSVVEQFQQLEAHASRLIVGQSHLINRMLIALLCDGHLLVEGAPGLAKTRAIKVLAESIEGDFHRLQFTPDLLPADLTGTDIYRPQQGTFEFRKGPLFHNLILADEINRAPAKVQSALLEAMEERQITVGDRSYPLESLFMVMATQNPIEQEGTYPLPEAQLDRFLLHVEVGYPTTVDVEGVRSGLEKAGFNDAQVQLFGADNEVLVRLPPQDEVASDELRERLRTALTNVDAGADLKRVESVSPQVGKELAERGALSMIIALLLIFLYVMIRFQWKFAAGAVVATAHDVIITVGFFAIFRYPFDLTVVAAVLAVIGYSLNDTVVVFDRIRENFFMLRGVPAEEAMNISINETMSRTINTGLTTLIVLVALLIFGGESIAPFSIALIVGILIGTYSSVYVASAIALLLNVTPLDLIEPVKDPDLIDDLP
jgi:preprotein translocase SecF subunit